MPDRIFHFSNFTDDPAQDIIVLNATHSAVTQHSHDFFEFVYVRSGFCLHEGNKETTLLVEGDCFLVRVGMAHRYVGSHAVGLFNCLFTKRALSGFLEELTALGGLDLGECADSRPVPPKLHLNLEEQKNFTRLIRGMMEDSENRLPGWKLKMRCRLACLLTDFARASGQRMQSAGENYAYPNYVVLALGAIDKRFSNPALSVSDIACEAGVSADYLSRQFRMLTGVGVQEYLRRYRFAKATELLLGGVSVGDTSGSVGFANLSHFSREFKKEMGVTPTQYARQNR